MGRKNDKKNNKNVKLPKMCLNMIVKNESHIIIETLTNILKYIDYWVISDTGSTDGTQELIKNFFKEKKIPGELVSHEWKNFGHNRTLAFEAAYNKSEYVWVIDADDLIVGELNLPKNLNKDMYLLKYGGTNLCYPRAQIFNNKLKWVYRGVLHEFAKCINNANIISEKIDGPYFIDSRRLGDRNKDPQKYLKDAQTLIKAIDDKIDPDLKERYLFYAGQSYRDCNDLENTIKYYGERTKLGGWNEEVYVSYMEIGNALVKQKAAKKDIVDAFINGFKTLPIRAECLFFLANYYLQDKDIENAYKTCKIASKIKNPTHLLLFIKTDIHIYKCKELLYIIYCLIQKNKVEIKNLTNETINTEKEILYDFLTTDSEVPDETQKRIKSIKENENRVLIEPVMLKDYIFIDNVDSFDGDIGVFQDKTINELEEIVELYDNCIGFNTYGFLKHTINLPLIPLANNKYMNDGIYIKRELAINIINKYGTNLLAIPEKITITTNTYFSSESENDETNDETNSSDDETDNESENESENETENEETNNETNSSSDNEMHIELNTKSKSNIEKIINIHTNEYTNKKNNSSDYYDNLNYDLYNEEMVKQITEHVKNKSNSNKKITLTITTCKRVDLFKRTINSFINCCSDILLIDEYLCVDDNSSKEDIIQMTELYPFFRWIIKNPEQKGHMQSMNIIVDEVKTDYMLHVEDDWLFCEKYAYIAPALEILDEQNIKSIKEIPISRNITTKKIGQVVFNKNYTELQENEVQGGFLCTTNKNNIEYLIHEHYDPNTENKLYEMEVKKYQRSAMYWPHFSLQPSLIKTRIFKDIGNFSSDAGFFERNFANKYYANGYITCFFNKVCCRHIGKLLSQRNDPNIKNAYELNQVNQFETNTDNIIDNYLFYQNKDSFDFDILYIANKSVQELKNIANSLPNCLGFNTLGYLKYKISNEKNFIFLPNVKNNPEGLYVKKIIK
jgi:hypothetical protein